MMCDPNDQNLWGPLHGHKGMHLLVLCDGQSALHILMNLLQTTTKVVSSMISLGLQPTNLERLGHQKNYKLYHLL